MSDEDILYVRPCSLGSAWSSAAEQPPLPPPPLALPAPECKCKKVWCRASSGIGSSDLHGRENKEVSNCVPYGLEKGERFKNSILYGWEKGVSFINHASYAPENEGSFGSDDLHGSESAAVVPL